MRLAETKITLWEVTIALGDENVKKTRKYLGRQPTAIECIFHYVEFYDRLRKEGDNRVHYDPDQRTLF